MLLYGLFGFRKGKSNCLVRTSCVYRGEQQDIKKKQVFQKLAERGGDFGKRRCFVFMFRFRQDKYNVLVRKS